jgi:type II secretory pathway pseudopilin PulG
MPKGTEGFTLTEIMVVASLFSLVVIGLISSHLFGIRMFNITGTKLSASRAARATLNHVRDEIRSGKILTVGNGGSGGFTNIAPNLPHEGNALQICATSDTNVWVRYYLDTANQTLMRRVSGTNPVETIASYITNRLVFQAEDFRGAVLTNDQNSRVIRMTLEIFQWEFPSAQVGLGGYYDYYRLQTKITRRAIE